ncbi:proprotein convertase P-domain-containing protein [Corallococcus macrosporus]|nr:proprotein convertase P-domain-containing protein [Corallococcus macrosporus]
MKTKFPLFVSLSALIGCGAPTATDGLQEAIALGTQTQALATGTPAAEGVLSFLNDYYISFNELDVQVPLNAQAAQALIDFREGPDGVLRTGDDRRFVSIEQVDAVPYVGPAALAALEAYAKGTGRVELPVDGHVGTFQGVSFNMAEARRAIHAANTESASTLENVFAIPQAAVQSLVAARPILHMIQLSRLTSVDALTLNQLKSNTQLGAEGDPCTGPGLCQPGLVCEGRPGDGSSPYGRCVDTAYLAGNGDVCSRFMACPSEGLICIGLASGWVEGYCAPAWMGASFIEYSDLRLQSTNPLVTAPLTVVGLATVPMDINVELDIVHTAPHRLVLTLEDPGGETALLWDGPNEGTPPSRIVVTRGIPRDGSINGRWKLHVANPSGVGSGTLRSWTLKLTSRYD